MSYPKIKINKQKLQSNLEFMANKLHKKQITLTAVTKVFSAYPEIVELYEACQGVDFLGDSRIKNLKSYADTAKPTILIRIPMPSEVDDVVRYADISFNSELTTIKLLDIAAKQQNKVHQILLMVDLGDLREGYYSEEKLLADLEVIRKLSHIKVIGVGVNLTCYGAVIPENKNLAKLIDYQKKIETALGYPLSMISGGNSSSLYLLDDAKQELPAGINNLRIGEALVLGQETAYEKAIVGMHQDVFVLVTELVEVKQKPSVPIGKIGVNAFGESPVFEDKGIMTRGIVAIGKQDVPEDGITPLDDNIQILGSSSDHLILDLTHCDSLYQVGDKISFKLAYGALLQCFTSQYVEKEFIDGKR